MTLEEKAAKFHEELSVTSGLYQVGQGRVGAIHAAVLDLCLAVLEECHVADRGAALFEGCYCTACQLRARLTAALSPEGKETDMESTSKDKVL